MIKSYKPNETGTDQREIRLKKVELPSFYTSEHANERVESDEERKTRLAQGKESEIKMREEELQRKEEELNNQWRQFEEEAAVIRQEMNQQAEQIFNEAAENGFNQGHQEGIEQGKTQCDEQIQEARQMIELARHDVVRRIEEAEPDILELSVAVASRILGKTVETHPETWLHMVKQAIYEVREQEEVKVYVPPDWYPMTIQGQRELQEVAVHVGELIILPDEQLSGHQCVLETPFGRVDASMDTQLLEIRHALFEVLKDGAIHE
ncbi:flagellar assembly protein FliH [Salisediminibacterium beveridgei]|uniref:Flagellar assembly protein FliH n=1 Tax=Salisediminibacterium beveridgei TaxID=632773 RepID=A0A1D7QW35_9BACI|nr:flagellar assembly protein FliH [Salisediminibacterium beveridgei]AOM83188.1 Flagellar assembly protein FliH [Salisediminibacterium beveridgei]